MSPVCLSRPADFGLFHASEWSPQPARSLLLRVHRGDLLQALRGTVWITVDGRPQDLLLSPGDRHTVDEDLTLRVQGFQAPRLQVFSREPVQPAQPRRWRDRLSAWSAALRWGRLSVPRAA